jgi:hypothetical protein|tara:strand:- start:8917 stop:9159 length:243 start_codon:yes stop_codon:yes gene_type:complete
MERRLGLKLENRDIEIRADKEVGDKWIGYQHFVIDHIYLQHQFELILKPVKIGLMVVPYSQFILTINFFKIFIQFGLGAR